MQFLCTGCFYIFSVKEFCMTNIQTRPSGLQGFCSPPPQQETSLPGVIIEKAEETLRRTNLQNAAKSPAGVAASAAKYIVADAIKANIISPALPSELPGAKYLNSKSAIKNYAK